MPGVKITLDTKEAVTGAKDLSKALDGLGKQGLETEKGLKRVSDESKKKLAADEAAKAAAKLTAALGTLEHSCNTVAKAMETAGQRAAATNRNMTTFSGGADGVTSKLAAMASKIGIAAAAYVVFQKAVSTAASSFAAFRDYETALTDMGRVTNESLASISKTIKGLPAELGDSTSMMKAYYQVLSAGVTDSAKAMDLLTVSAKSSKAAHVEQEQTVKGLTKLMAGYDGAIKSAAEASDLLFRIDNLGQTSFAELVPVIGDIAAISNLAGLKVGEMASSMAVLTQTSGSTSEAATKLKAIAVGLYKPTESMGKVIKALGYESGVAMVQQNGLAGSLQILKSVTDTAGVSMGKLFESSEALVGIAALSANGWGTYIDTLKKMGQGANETEEAFQRWIKTSQAVKDMFDATINKLGIEFGEQIAPIMVKGMQDFVDVVINNKGTIIGAFKAIAEAIELVVGSILKVVTAYRGAIYNIAAGIAVSKGEMEWGAWIDAAAKGPDALGKAMDAASAKVIEKKAKYDRAVKGYDILHNDNKGTIPELVDIKAGAEDYTNAVSGTNKATKELAATGGKAADVFNSLNKTAFDPKKIQLAANAMGDHDKKLKGAANAAAKYGESANTFYENTARSIEQLQDSLTGGTEKNANRVDDWFKDQFANISKAVIGAKGDVEKYKEAWALLEKMWPGIKMLAVTKDLSAELKKQSQLLKDIADATGDPAMSAKASVYEADSWYAEKKQLIESTYKDESEKAAMMAALQDGYNAKLLKGRADAYSGVKAVSSEYWAAEKQLLEANLEKVKAHATDETAYKIYAAQQWDEFYKAQMESQAANAGSFAETLSAKWSLAFGGYKSETTKAKESWGEMSDSIINASNGMIDGVAGGFGDMIRNIGNGTASIEDMWKNMLSRMLDMFASFVEDLIKSQLKKMIGGLFADTTTNALSSTVSSVSNMRDGGTGSTNAIGSVISTGKSIGKGIMSVFSSGESESTNFLNKLSDAAGIEKTVQAASTSGYTALTSGASQGGALATGASNLASTGTSLLSTIGSTLGVIGAIGGVVGIVASLFGEKKEEVKKTASGYTVNYAGGKTTSTGIDFYSDGSTVGTGPNDPDVTKKISDAFKEAAENLADFADVLGFTVDVLDGFQMPSMDITSDQLDGYIRNGTNAMAFQALEQAGLRGAFDKLAEDGEVYIDEVERLATAYSAGSAKLSAYGYDMADVAQVTTAQIEELRAQTIETAAGTAQATMLMAESMGATSDQLAELAANASDGSQALAVTDEQLSNLLEADWVSKVEDAVGGEDAFNGIMDNLIKNVFDSVGAYAENLDFYGEKASTAITKLNDSSITVDNFWEKFNEALKGGMDPDTFELWSKASTWVNSIDTVNEALKQWNRGMLEMGQALDARMETANGYDYQAALTKQLASAEKELYDAREAGYDAAYIAKLQTVQAAEMLATTAKHQEDYAKAVQDAQSSIADSTDDNATKIAIAMAQNAAEYKDYEKEFTHAIGSDDSLFRALEEQYAAEIGNMVQAVAEGIASAIESLNLDSREATVSGKSDLAGALDKVAAATKEYADALAAGVDDDTLTRLVEVQQSELEQYWAAVENSGVKTQETLIEIRDRLSSSLDTLISKQTDLLNSALDNAKTLAAAYHSAADSIADTLKTWSAEDDPTKNAEDNFYDVLADFNKTFALALKGDTSALSALPSDATNVKDAASKYFGNADEYSAVYRELVKRLQMAEVYSDILGNQQDALSMLYEIDLNLYNLLKDELAGDDPNTEKLEQIAGAIGTTNNFISTIEKSYNASMNAFDSLGGAYNLSKEAWTSSNTSMDVIGNNIGGVGTSIDGVSTSVSGVGTSVGGVGTAVIGVNTVLDTVSKAVDGVGGELFTVGTNIGNGNTYLQDTSSNTSKTQTAAEDLRRVTESGDGGFLDITDAINKSVPGEGSYLDQIKTKATDINTALGKFIQSMKAQNAQNSVDAAYSKYQESLGTAVSTFKNSGVADYIQAYANTGAGWTEALGNLFSTSDAWGGQTYIDYAMSGNQTAEQLQQWLLSSGGGNYGIGSGYVDWELVMRQWYSKTGGNFSGSWRQAESDYQTYLQRMQQMQNIGGYADGGISTGKQLAWVSEGAYASEAHVPLPDGSTIPVTMTSNGTNEGMAEVKAELKSLRADLKEANSQIINYVKITANMQKKWDSIGTPAVQTTATA